MNEWDVYPGIKVSLNLFFLYVLKKIFENIIKNRTLQQDWW